MLNFPEELFVTGTDTDVGKTVVSAALVLGLQGHYYKPFQSGTDDGTDQEWIKQATGLGDSHFSPEGCRFKAPLSPNQAAALENTTLAPQDIGLPHCDQKHLIIEGVGGLMVPLNQETLLIDWLKPKNLPVLLVARSGLGTLNHTLLSVAALKQRGIPLWGIVLNGPKNPRNAADIQQFSGVRFLAQVDYYDELNPDTLSQLFSQLCAS